MLTSITHGAKTLTYDPNNYRRNIGTISLPNGWEISHSYDSSGRIDTIDVRDGSTLELAREYDFDNAGDRTVVASETNVANETTSYAYDTLDRLTAAVTENYGGTPIDEWAFGLDKMNNVVDVTNNGATTWNKYNTANQLCWSKTGGSRPNNNCNYAPGTATTYTHDNHGNQTGDSNGRTNTYNTFNQAISQSDPTGGAVNTHTYLGDRLVERNTTAEAGTSTTRLRTITGVTSLDDGTTDTVIVRDPNGQPVAIEQDGDWGYYLRDARGSIIGITNDAGNLVNQYDYTPYGEATETTSTGWFDSPYQYLGAEYNDTTGLLHLNYRDYNPDLGRFTQADPAGYSAGPNLYTYTAGDPINRADPSGLWPDFDLQDYLSGIAGAAVGTVTAATCTGASFGFGAVPCAALGLTVGAATAAFLASIDE